MKDKQLAKWADDNLQLMDKSSIARYENLKYIISKYKPKTICEIGVNLGGIKFQGKLNLTIL